jgi:ribosomal RNA-processing protein 9
VHGHINSIAMGPGGKFCVAAVGQEPRMGRWDRVPRAKNRFAIIRLHGGDKSK